MLDHSAVLGSLGEVPGELALLSLAGSHAYGTNHPRSDLDYKGTYVAPLDAVLALRAPMQTFDRRDPDIVIYELSHFCRLAGGNNPTVLQILWGPAVHMTLIGGKLVARRKIFLSRWVRNTFGGYAIGQLEKARKGTGGSRGVAHLRREKFLLHTLRLLDAGIEILETGEVPVRVEDPERLWARARQPLDVIEREAAGLMTEMDRALAATDLPERPDWEAINALVYEIRMGEDSVTHWGS